MSKVQGKVVLRAFDVLAGASRFGKPRGLRRAGAVRAGIRGMVGRVLAVAAVLVSVALVAAASAPAMQTRFFKEAFGPDGTSATQFLYPWSVGVDESLGTVYVGSISSVRKFSASHAFEPFTGISGNISEGAISGFGNFGEPHEIAVDSRASGAGAHDLYVLNEAGAVAAYLQDGEPADFSAGPDAGTNQLTGSQLCGVAVDASGDIYVSEFGTGIHIFAPSGALLTTVASPNVCNLAVTAAGVVYAVSPEAFESTAAGPVIQFAPSAPPPVTGATTYEADGVVDANPARSVAVDPGDEHLLAAENNDVAEYDQAGVRLGTFGSRAPNPLSEPFGLAVDGSKVLVANSTGSDRQVNIYGAAVVVPDATTGVAEAVEPQGSALLTGTVDPDGVAVTECVFEYGVSEEYGDTAPCSQAVGSGTHPVSVSAHVAGLEPGATYHFRVRADNANGPSFGEDMTFETPARPALHGETTSDLNESSVVLEGDVNPQGALSVTECRFEWGLSTGYEHNAPCEQPVGAGTADVFVSRHVSGLSANETYHWRLVAVNAAGTTDGADHTFIYDTSGEGLPDDRAYEMVTPVQKDGALINSYLFGAPPQIAASGSRVMATSIQCLAGAQSCTADRRTEGEPFLFSRTPTGWVTTALAPPANQYEATTTIAYSAETGTALFLSPTAPAFEDDFYAIGESLQIARIGPLTPPAEGARGPDMGALVATSGFSTLVFSYPTAGGNVLMDLSGTNNAQASPVGVTGGPGSEELISSCGTYLGIHNNSNPGVVSEDGNTVFFGVAPCGGGTGGNAGTPVPVADLYARLTGKDAAAFASHAPADCVASACTVKLSERSSSTCTTTECRESEPEGAEFIGASDNGTIAIFTSTQQLTDDARQGQRNLYEYNFASAPSEALTDITAGAASPEGAGFAGVMALSGDASHVYFVGQGVLTSEPNATEGVAQNGQDNLYVYERDSQQPAGKVRFITQLPGTEAETGWGNDLQTGIANVTPSGGDLVFESFGSLVPGKPTHGIQIYRYDAESRTLQRVSTGEQGYNDDGDAGVGNAHIIYAWESDSVNALPGRRDPTMSDDGQYVFFESPRSLTPHALNDVIIGTHNEEGENLPVYAMNVYEWHEGRVSLISDGRDTGRVLINSCADRINFSSSCLLGTDATGRNVFITSSDRLVRADTDTQVDIYDARICTASEPCIPDIEPEVPPCAGEACHGIPSAQPGSAEPPTATFSGAGNLQPTLATSKPPPTAPKPAKRKTTKCHKTKKHRHAKCVKTTHKSARNVRRAQGRTK